MIQFIFSIHSSGRGNEPSAAAAAAEEEVFFEEYLPPTAAAQQAAAVPALAAPTAKGKDRGVQEQLLVDRTGGARNFLVHQFETRTPRATDPLATS